MKTSIIKEAMSPILALILGKMFEYLAAHADDIVKAITDQFTSAKKDPEVVAALQNFGYAPTEESLNKLHDLLAAKGEDPQKLAKILINQTTV